jgi:hypothetical protein
LKYPSAGDWQERNTNPNLSIAFEARNLANLIEESEKDTPKFGLDGLESMQSRTTDELELAVSALNKRSLTKWPNFGIVPLAGMLNGLAS